MHERSTESFVRTLSDLYARRRAWWRALSTSRQILLLSLLALTLLFLRRPMQFLHPDVWVEDGTHLIPDTYLYGVKAVMRPLNGYLVIVPRLINLVAMQFPLEVYPEVSTALAVAFDVFVVLSIARCPTVLRHRELCAIMVLLIPIYSEVYVLPSYTFWFASLLTVLALLWRSERDGAADLAIRTCYVIAGGLSSPISILLLPLFAVRAIMIRRRSEQILLAVAGSAAIIQLLHVLPRNAPKLGNEPVGVLLELTVAKFFGGFLVSPSARVAALLVGSALLAYVIYSFISAAANLDATDARLAALLYLLLPLAIMASVARAPVTLINPIDGGPRYFFFPYIFLSWILINPPRSKPVLAKIGVVVVILAILNGASHFVRPQDPTDWKEAVRIYRSEGSTELPVHYTGEGGFWKVEFPPSER